MKLTLLIIAFILASIALFINYNGGFKKVDCRVEVQGGETLVYKEMIGDYAKSKKLSDEIYFTLLRDYEIETYKGFGIYYDNPKHVKKSELRSEIGCILEEKDSSKVAQISGELKIKTFPQKAYIVSEFPFKGKLAVIFGILKVYPAMDKFVEENGYSTDGAVMEIYDIPNRKILYRKEIIPNNPKTYEP